MDRTTIKDTRGPRRSPASFPNTCSVQVLRCSLDDEYVYHPQTDGQSENFHKTFLSVLKAFVNKYYSNWEECIPSVLYACHNTVHSSTGFTPHHLLFGWTPQDLRVPFVAAELNDSDITRNVEGWVELRKEQLKRANINLEYTGLLW